MIGTGDSVFISYRHETGHAAASIIADELQQLGCDVWWLKEKIEEASMLDGIVDRAIDNCSRCIIVWSDPELSPWQQAEVIRFRTLYELRSPVGDPTERFLVVRCQEDGSTGTSATLQLLGNVEYVSFVDRLDVFQRMSGRCMGWEWVTCHGERFPVFNPPRDEMILRGKRSLTGHFNQRGAPLVGRAWIFLWAKCPDWAACPEWSVQRRQCRLRYAEGSCVNDAGKDTPRGVCGSEERCTSVPEWGNDWLPNSGEFYVQQPRPVVTHKQRWYAPNIVIGDKHVKSIVLVSLDEEAHRQAKKRVLRGEFGGIPIDELPTGFRPVQRIDIVQHNDASPTFKMFSFEDKWIANDESSQHC